MGCAALLCHIHLPELVCPTNMLFSHFSRDTIGQYASTADSVYGRSYAVLTQQPGHMFNSAVGFSGVLFAFVVIESFHSLVGYLNSVMQYVAECTCITIHSMC